MTNDPSRLLIVASNRGPVSYSHAADGSLTARRGGGGLVSGLMSGLGAVAADGGGALAVRGAQRGRTGPSRGRPARPPATPGEVPVRMLDIPAGVFAAAYNGIANSVLWFVHHLLFDTPNQPHFDAAFRADWAAYVAYNEAFAAALAQECAPGDPRTDPGLPPVARAAAASRPPPGGADRPLRAHPVGAARATTRCCPTTLPSRYSTGCSAPITSGSLPQRWADAFLDCCAAVLGAQVTRGDAGTGRVVYRDRVTAVAVHPLGVDAAELRARARAADVREHARKLAELAGGRQLIVRVDRTELSKNIVRGLAAYRELLATRPEWRGRVTHLAFAYPSRSDAARVPGLHGARAAARRGDQRRVPDAGLGTAYP